ncbi:hypothetical protein JOB18_022528 [Solea senegalensis]|uniref:Uncharacterized protein n=1 Tax=Solea senegalensis TaxID=28829 RepID=A0AAV6PX82_SOLSE|nr:hypothetical protein JOB18_022528 [Solea senegalensis]
MQLERVYFFQASFKPHVSMLHTCMCSGEGLRTTGRRGEGERIFKDFIVLLGEVCREPPGCSSVLNETLLRRTGSIKITCPQGALLWQAANPQP